MQYLIDKLKSLNGKTFTVFGLVAAFVGVLYFYGCESRTYSLLEPSRRITRIELTAEIAVMRARLIERTNDLDRQDALRKFVAEQASVISTGGSINPIGAINALISVFAVGYAVDAKRKLAIVNKANPTATT